MREGGHTVGTGIVTKLYEWKRTGMDVVYIFFY
jgi:hypothetical protein